MPFRADLSIDESALRRHLNWLLESPIGGVVCNGHAAEVATLTREERRRSAAVTVETVAGRVPVIAGVYADGTEEAIRLARDAGAEGVDGLLVFPSPLFSETEGPAEDMVLTHFAAIGAAADLPLVVFEYPRRSGSHYEPDLLVRLVRHVPQIVAVKEWSLDILDYEDNLTALRAAAPDVAILSSFSTSLLATLVLGADGILSGHGSLIADLQCRLFQLVQSGDLDAARRLNRRLHPLTRTFYAPPFQDAHSRMKFASFALGRLPEYHVRGPLQPISADQQREIASCVRDVGLPTQGAQSQQAAGGPTLSLRAVGTGEVIEVSVRRLLVAGFTGRDAAAVDAHAAELRVLGVEVPEKLPIVMEFDPAILTISEQIRTARSFTSGEVEPVLVVHQGIRWLTVGSDHTDRDLERESIPRAKETCPKLVARSVVALDMITDWDALELQSWVDEEDLPYQDGRVGELLPLAQIEDAVAAAGSPLGEGDVLFLGTVPVSGGRLRSHKHFRATLRDRASGQDIHLQYTVVAETTEGAAGAEAGA